jgi:hypothetical protein
MSHKGWAVIVVALAVAVSLVSARAQADDDRYTIMREEPSVQKPEPWLPPKYQSPRGSREHVVIPPATPAPQLPAGVPPPLYVPQTGRTLPNLPNPAPSGPNGSESSQDRAARCAHQAGVYGQAAGDRSTYINSCINQ